MRFRLRTLLLAVPVVLTLAVGPVLGQKSTAILPPDGTGKLEQDYKKHSDTIKKLMQGENPQPKEEQQEAIDTLAKWHTYRLTWDRNQKEAGRITDLMTELDRDLQTIAKKKPATQGFLDELTRQMIVRAKEVLQNDSPVARVNAARVLDRLAQEGEDEVGDALLEIVKDPKQNDGARYYALLGLRDLLASHYAVPMPQPMKDRAKEERILLGLIEFIERKVTIPPGMSAEEQAGLGMLRRRAVEALGLPRLAAWLDAKKALQGKIALVLLRVLRNDGTIPQARLDERLEAAIGLARIQCNSFDGYQPDYTAHHVGVFVADFAKAYAEAPMSERGWKVAAGRLKDALAAMQTDVATMKPKNPEVQAYVKDVVEEARPVLQLIETKGAVNPAKFDNWIRNKPPKNDQVYKGVDDSKVKPGGDTPPAAEK